MVAVAAVTSVVEAEADILAAVAAVTPVAVVDMAVAAIARHELL